MANSSIYNTLFGGANVKHGGAKNVGAKNVGAKKSMQNLMQLFNEKKGFLTLVFANLIVQLGITYYVMMHFNENLSKNEKAKQSFTQTFLMLFIQLGIIFILALVPMPAWLKFILFTIFSYTFGITLSYVSTPSNAAIIQAAVAGTISIFAAMFAFGLLLILFGIQLGLNFGMFLFFSLLALILFQVVSLFMGAFSVIHKVLTILGLLIFSLYIVYDTNSILQREYYGDFITASMDYYLDVINIFINLFMFYENN